MLSADDKLLYRIVIRKVHRMLAMRAHLVNPAPHPPSVNDCSYTDQSDLDRLEQ